MIVMRQFVYGSILAALAGCTTLQPYSPSTVVIKAPSEGVVSKAELGDTLMIYAVKEDYDALAIEDSQEYNVCLYMIRIEDQIAYASARTSAGKPIFTAKARSKTLGTWGDWLKTIRIEPSGKDQSKLSLTDPSCGGPQPFKNSYKKTKAVKLEDPAFSQELIYNGRVGNSVKFIYREFSNQMARAAFSQEVQYDLELSKIIGFKGVRIEIIDATNSEITYQVKNHFKVR